MDFYLTTSASVFRVFRSIALMQVFPKPIVLTTKPGIDAIRSLHI